jgi:hypothetical protein
MYSRRFIISFPCCLTLGAVLAAVAQSGRMSEVMRPGTRRRDRQVVSFGGEIRRARALIGLIYRVRVGVIKISFSPSDQSESIN